VLSDRAGEAALFVPDVATGLASVEGANRGGKGHFIAVPARTLDSLTTAKTDFVKIDVEGHEASVVAGGLTLLERDRPMLLIEAEERHHSGSLRALEALLSPLGYEGFFVHAGTLVPLAQFDATRHQSLQALNAAGTAQLPGTLYINNFLFFPPRSPVLARVRSALAVQGSCWSGRRGC
jgi:hypothetical protein